MSRVFTTALVGGVLVLFPSAANAQTTGTAPVDSNRQYVTANPFMTMFEWFNVEYAREHKTSTTWGASASRIGRGDVSYSNVTALYRYYPKGKALNGFYVGARGGVHRVSAFDESGVAFGAGFELGYDWLLGRKKNFAVGLGAGATRLFGADLDDVSMTVPTLRLVNIGWSF